MKKLLTIPRTIGLVMLILAALTFKRGIIQAVLLAIAGLVLLLTPTKSAAKHWQDFVKTFSFKKKIVYVALFDILFWVLLTIFALFLRNVLHGPIEQLRSIQIGESVSMGTLEASNAILESFFTTAIVSLILFWIFVVLAYSLSRGLIWLTLLDKKAKSGFFIKFSLLNIIWITLWLAVFLFFMSTMHTAAATYTFVVLLLLYAHLTSALHYSYVKSSAFAKSFKDSFSVGIGRIGKFIHPYCYMLIIYVILNQLQQLATGTISTVIAFIVFLAFMAWYRNYLREVLARA